MIRDRTQKPVSCVKEMLEEKLPFFDSFMNADNHFSLIEPQFAAQISNKRARIHFIANPASNSTFNRGGKLTDEQR